MTYKTVADDQRFLWPCLQGGTILVGRNYSKHQDGENRLPTEPQWMPHPYLMVLSDIQTGVKRKLYTSGSGGRDEVLTMASQPIRPWTISDDYALYGKFADKYDDGAFSTPVFAGELGETTDMLAGRLRHLAAVGRAVRKGNMKRAAKLLGVSPPRNRKKPEKKGAQPDNPYMQSDQTITSAWLELQYGWTPLFRDISDLSDAIAKRDKPRSQRIYANHWIGKEGFGLACEVAGYVGTGKLSKSITAYVSEVLPPISSRLGLQDPASVMWELTPFSFVADWVLPIGNYLKARSIATRATGIFVVTKRDRHHFSLSSMNCPAESGKLPATVELLAWTRYCRLERTVTDTLPTVKLPNFTNPLGGRGPGDRLMSAVSLVREIFGSKTSKLV